MNRLEMKRGLVSYGKGRVSEMVEREREKESSETDRMSYRPREGERAFTHGDSLVI